MVTRTAAHRPGLASKRKGKSNSTKTVPKSSPMMGKKIAAHPQSTKARFLGPGIIVRNCNAAKKELMKVSLLRRQTKRLPSREKVSLRLRSNPSRDKRRCLRPDACQIEQRVEMEFVKQKSV